MPSILVRVCCFLVVLHRYFLLAVLVALQYGQRNMGKFGAREIYSIYKLASTQHLFTFELTFFCARITNKSPRVASSLIVSRLMRYPPFSVLSRYTNSFPSFPSLSFVLRYVPNALRSVSSLDTRSFFSFAIRSFF